MSEEEDGIARARLLDLFRPARLYVGLAEQPRFVLATLLLTACAVLYSQVALHVALPKLLPDLLERSTLTQSELSRDFRLLVLCVAVLFPWLFVMFFAFGSWATLRATGRRIPFFLVLALFAHASLWAALGLAAKTGLVLLTHTQEPPVNLALLLQHPSRTQSVLLAFTNPFLLLAMAWTVRGLRSWSAGRVPGLLAGAGPWALWIAVSAVGSGGTGGFAPAGPVTTETWSTITRPTVVLEYPPGMESSAPRIAEAVERFTQKLAERFDFTPRQVRIRLFASHADLERATGEFLHVKLTGSIRGPDLLYLEMPGRNVALPEEEGLQEALRYVALMQLPFVPGLDKAPRWFVEGIAHAAAIPFTPLLQEEYRAALRRDGVPSFAIFEDPATFRTPEGPLFARAVVDDLAFRYGKDVLDLIRQDLARGATFRDALYSRTRLTTSALESEWQDAAIALLKEAPPTPVPAPEDTSSTGRLSPFLRRW